MLQTTVTQRFTRNVLIGLLPALALVATACAPSEKNSALGGIALSAGASKIVNGTDASVADISANGLAESVVLVVGQQAEAPPSKGVMVSTCTGTLITRQIVLTAAHCVSRGLRPADLIVGLKFTRAMQPGEDDKVMNPLATAYRVKNFAVNAGYSERGTGQQQNDIALILLDHPVPATVRLATLPEAALDVETLDAVLAIGYGMSVEKHSTAQDHTGGGILRYTTFAKDKFGNVTPQPDRNSPFDGMIATVADQTSICHGDSGGPLMAVTGTASTNTVVGINDAVLPHYAGQQQVDYQAAELTGKLDDFYKKYPDANICSGGLNVFVNVAAQLTWINQKVAELQVQAANPTLPVPQVTPPADRQVAPPVATPAPAVTPAQPDTATPAPAPRKHHR